MNQLNKNHMPYKKPSLTVDIVIINIGKELILIKRKNEPYKNFWAIPGGFVEYGETVENAAIREAKEETNIDVELLDICGVYSNPKRDPRGHVISIGFLAKGDIKNMNAGDDAKDIHLFSIKDLKNINLAFDHDIILKDALNLFDIRQEKKF